MPGRKSAILFALMVAIIFAGIFVLRGSSGEPAGPPTTSRAEVLGDSTAPRDRSMRSVESPGDYPQGTFATLEGREDGELASQAFRHVQYCLQSRRLTGLASKVADAVVGARENEMSARERSALAESLGVAERLLGEAQRTALDCAELSEKELEEALPAALRAANAGDLLAMNCYVGTDFTAPPPGLFDHPEWLTEYKQYAPVLMKKAIERGDWAMVGQRARASMEGPSWISQITRKDPVENYGYLRLLRLGASGVSDTGTIDQLLNTAARSLSEESRHKADNWARQTFENSFGGVPDREGMSRRPPCQLVGGSLAN